MKSTPVLQVNNLKVIYPNGTVAVESIRFDTGPGEIIAIIGRSGSGKSTLLRCINGLQHFQEGSILFEGQNIRELSEYHLRQLRKRIGFIWQEHNLVERMSALKNVLAGRLGFSSFYASATGFFSSVDRDIALYNLERVHLLHRAYHRADELSGGEKQRVAIARALSQQPKLLLADEPVCCLDPELAWIVIRDLEQLAREDNVLTLINLHHVEFAKAIADRIIGIANGTVVFDGKPEELTQSAMNAIYKNEKNHGKKPGAEAGYTGHHEEPIAVVS